MDTLERAATLVDQYRYLEAYDLIEKADLDAKVKARQLTDIALKLRQHFERYAPVPVNDKALQHQPDKGMLEVYQLLIERDYRSAREVLESGAIEEARAEAWLRWMDKVYEQEKRIFREPSPPDLDTTLSDEADMAFVKVVSAFIFVGGILLTIPDYIGVGALIILSALPVGWYVTQLRHIHSRTTVENPQNLSQIELAALSQKRQQLNSLLSIRIYGIIISFFISGLSCSVFSTFAWGALNWSSSIDCMCIGILAISGFVGFISQKFIENRLTSNQHEKKTKF